MFRALTALAMASAAATPTIHSAPTTPAKPGASTTIPQKASETLPNSPWWEKITVTISGDGKPQGCKFESSVKPAHSCDVVGGEAAEATSSSAASASAKAEYTRITFERRFQPGAQPKADDLQPGETLLGGQVMALGIDSHGLVKACKIVSEAGSVKPEYGCEQAKTEHFEASAASPRAAADREGYMTIVVYGHSEHVV